MSKITAYEIDAVLPQTQCGLCNFKGCMPYAEAMVAKSAPIHLCPPGGIDGLKRLGQLLDENPEPYLDEMNQKAKPPMRAVIRETECIGCTKCIQACPVDAIMGSAKLMHTVLSDECTGCELCIAPCPVDCIDMISAPPLSNKKDQFRKRYQARNKRLLKKNKITKKSSIQPQSDKRSYIEAALLRVKEKREASTSSSCDLIAGSRVAMLLDPAIKSQDDTV